VLQDIKRLIKKTGGKSVTLRRKAPGGAREGKIILSFSSDRKKGTAAPSQPNTEPQTSGRGKRSSNFLEEEERPPSTLMAGITKKESFTYRERSRGNRCKQNKKGGSSMLFFAWGKRRSF